ncbi:uncharacterized protein LOC113274464 [Papaver somniferum]|uniref:uncharacterized protein LOC113274464 n=1 Tax=Papaver somniferum TaxID=3469 RepID=UPI000E6FDA37|nr:uncharacterized protein LOC113274464 [Papaver somniferum]
METKVSEARAKVLMQSYCYPNLFFVSSIGLSGGLVLMWKDGFPCDLVSSNNNMIHLLVTSDASKQEWLLSCVYGSSHYVMKQHQWEFIRELGDNVYQPWVIIGDLNIHLNKQHASTSTNSLDNWVCNVVDSVGLMDMGYVGTKYTWSNKTNGKGYKRARIDYALHNSSWVRDYPNSKVLHLPFLGSDHCPLLLITDSFVPRQSKGWKFFRCWLQDSTCVDLILNTWTSTPINMELNAKLGTMRKQLSKWNKHHFGSVHSNVQHLLASLSQLQAKPFSDTISEEISDTIRELEYWKKIEADFWNQKSRDHWVQDMDNNALFSY